jgi:hypothetical protein
MTSRVFKVGHDYPKCLKIDMTSRVFEDDMISTEFKDGHD